jgi:hypothetical protein
VSYFTLTASEAVVNEHLFFADIWRILMQYIQPRLFVGAFLISPPAGAEVATVGSNRMTSSVSPTSRTYLGEQGCGSVGSKCPTISAGMHCNGWMLASPSLEQHDECVADPTELLPVTGDRQRIFLDGRIGGFPEIDRDVVCPWERLRDRPESGKLTSVMLVS